MSIKFFNRNPFKSYNRTSSKLWITLLLALGVVGGLTAIYGCTQTQNTNLTANSKVASVQTSKPIKLTNVSVSITPDKPSKFKKIKFRVNDVSYAQVQRAINATPAQVTKTMQNNKGNENCTIRQYAAKKIKSERFYCKIEGNDILSLYVNPDGNSIAWMDISKQVYVFNHNQRNSKLVVNGKVKMNKNSWEFVPQRNQFMVGPKRVEVVLDQK